MKSTASSQRLLDTEAPRAVSVPAAGAPAYPRVPVAAIAVVCCAVLIFVMGRFSLADVLGIKRFLQAALIVPVAVAAVWMTLARPSLLLQPLVCLALLLLVSEVALRRDPLRLADISAALLALAVLAYVTDRSIVIGARFIVFCSTAFALLGLVQWVVLFGRPELWRHAQIIYGETGISGDFSHPIAWLGFVTGESYTLFGASVTRLRSFASEPSLLLIYFLLPAVIALMAAGRRLALCALPLIVFSALSLSGSIFLSLFLSMVSWFSIKLFGVKKTMVYVPLLLLAVFLWTLSAERIDVFGRVFDSLAQYGDFFAKSRSFNQRSAGMLAALTEAMASPLGSPTPVQSPVPLIIGAVLTGGWLALLMLLWFVSRIGAASQSAYSSPAGRARHRLGVLVFAGIVFVVLIFNDYSMTSYGGLVMLMFAYRIVRHRATVLLAAAPRRRRRRAREEFGAPRLAVA